MKKVYKMAIFCICVLFGGLVLPVSVLASEKNVQMESRMTCISACGTGLSISDDGMASISGYVRGKPGVTSTYVKVTLQKKVSGGWTDVESWDGSGNVLGASVSETYQVSRGTYRVVMTCSADDETQTATSAERTY